MAAYTVVWPVELDNEYIELWLRSNAVDRKRLTRISHVIHKWLRWNPAQLGVPIPTQPRLRIWLLPEVDQMVSVLYHVNDMDRIVTMVRISIASN